MRVKAYKNYSDYGRSYQLTKIKEIRDMATTYSKSFTEADRVEINKLYKSTLVARKAGNKAAMDTSFKKLISKVSLSMPKATAKAKGPRLLSSYTKQYQKVKVKNTIKAINRELDRLEKLYKQDREVFISKGGMKEYKKLRNYEQMARNMKGVENLDETFIEMTQSVKDLTEARISKIHSMKETYLERIARINPEEVGQMRGILDRMSDDELEGFFSSDYYKSYLDPDSDAILEKRTAEGFSVPGQFLVDFEKDSKTGIK